MASMEILKQENLFLKKLIDEIPLSIYWKDLKGVYLGRNFYALEKMIEQGFEVKLDKNFVVGKTDYDLFPQEIANQFRENDLAVIKSGKESAIEEDFLDRAGNRYYHLSIKKPIYEDYNQKIPIGIIGISVNVTDRKKVEILAKEKELSAEKIQAMKTLAASIAHELRTPLRTVSNNADLVKEYMPLLLDAYQAAIEANLPIKQIDPFLYKGLTTAASDIESEIQEAFVIIDMLLTKLNRTGETQTTYALNQTSIKYCIEAAIRRYPFDAGEHEKVHYAIKEDFTFKGDESLIIHVLFNLFKNAFYQIKAANKGEISLWIEVDENYNVLHFKDTAKGITDEKLPHIFKQFFTDTYHGSGIGLAFCKMVMEGMGGEIECRAQAGKYAEFILYFPKEK